jgi:hypothetical protein
MKKSFSQENKLNSQRIRFTDLTVYYHLQFELGPSELPIESLFEEVKILQRRFPFLIRN